MRVLPSPNYLHQLGSSEHTTALELLQGGVGKGAILSPRDILRDDYTEKRIAEIFSGLRAAASELLIDPQTFDPAEIDSDGDPQWDNTKGLASSTDLAPFIRQQL